MGNGSSSYRIAGIAIALCLVTAGFITILSSPHESVSSGGRIEEPETGTGLNTSGLKASPTGTLTRAPSEASRMRVLWYDSTSRTYTFRDYDRPLQTDASTWTDKDLPTPENGTLQRQAAMVRFLEWDGKMERMTGTKYLTDQETIAGILNSYTLIAPPPPIQPNQNDAQTPTPAEPTPDITPAPGMLIPTMYQPCNQGDGTIQISFGYTNRHNTPVSLSIGERNRFSPGEPDRGQPTTFLPGIHANVFTVNIPENGTNIVWNLMNTPIGAGNVLQLHSGLLAEPIAGYAPLTVRFTDQSTGGTPENRRTGLWNFGDGTTSEADEISHRYESSGSYQVTRTVSTTCGSETSRESISVFKAAFTAEPVIGASGTLQFRDQSDGDPTAWFWDFSDGFTSWEHNPQHTWKKPGTYSVGLRVSGKTGTGTVVNTVTV
ncbi:MAG: PKD domain-containing protein [Methanobacteriota archaeon]